MRIISKYHIDSMFYGRINLLFSHYRFCERNDTECLELLFKFRGISCATMFMV